jgi:dTDP-4-amino-4,6-dideoxygalactose transaminase
MQAAILRVKLRELDRWNAARQRIAAHYDARLAGTTGMCPSRAPDRTHVFHQYVVRVPERERVRAVLAAAGIPTAIHYPAPVHRQPAYAALGDGARLDETEKLSAEILSLPMHPHLGTESAERVAAALLRAL